MHNGIAGIERGRVRNRAVFVLACCLAAAAVAAGAERPAEDFRLALVRDGQPQASIVLADKPTYAAQLAAFELQYHLKLISGAEVPIVTDAAEVMGPRILVGQSRYTEQLGLRGDDFKPQEYLIRIAPGTLVLMGRDAPNYEQVDYHQSLSKPWYADDGTLTRTISEFFAEQATMYAVYDFLERFCQVRWYAPGDVGLVHPTWPTVMLATGQEVRRSPAMKYRWSGERGYPNTLYPLPPPAGWGTMPPREQRLFWHRHRIGGEPYACGHSFYGYYRRFPESSHPEWYAQGIEEGSTGRQLCYTHPEVIRQVVQDARDYFDGKGLKDEAFGMGDYFALEPMDNYRGYCTCPRCQKLIKPFDGAFSFVSDYWFTFVNSVAREVAKTHPGKWIATLVYHGRYRPPDFPIEPNVILQLCLGPRNLSAKAQEGDQGTMDAWAAVCRSDKRPMYVWLWYCYPYLWFQPFPGFFGNHVPPMIERYLQAGVRGISYEPSYLKSPHHTLSHFLMDQVEFYMTWRLADDPSQNGAQMLHEFFTRYYGAAAGVPMERMYGLMEDIYANSDGYAFTDEFVYGQLATEANMAALAPLMQQALAAGGTELEQQRVRIFEQGIWQPIVAGRAAYEEKLPELKRQAERAATTVPPEVEAPPLKVAPGADFAQVDWQASVRLEPFKTLVGEATERQVQAAIAHDDAHLYLRLSEALKPAELVVNDSVWTEDNWEIFIGPERRLPYCHIGINSAGKYMALRHIEGGGEQQWQCDPKVVSKVSEAEGWTLVLALPLQGLLPELPGAEIAGGVGSSAVLYLNIIRSSGGGSRALAWSPTFAGFYVPERMGKVRFGAK